MVNNIIHNWKILMWKINGKLLAIAQEKISCSLVLKLKKWAVLYFQVLTAALQHGVWMTRAALI